MTRIVPTTLTYLEDAYRTSCKATVVAVEGERVALDRTVFYPGGGGQPPDRGTLSRAGEPAVAVTAVRRVDEIVWHTVAEPRDLAPGMAVDVRIDWQRRHLLMRTHSAMHVLCGVMYLDFDAAVTGHDLGPGEGRCDFEVASVAGGFGARVEARVNDEIARDLAISSEYVPRSAVRDDPALIRSKADLVPAHIDPLRIVSIAGLDRQADSGTHVRATREIGRVRVTRTESKGASNKRIRIAIDDG